MSGASVWVAQRTRDGLTRPYVQDLGFLYMASAGTAMATMAASLTCLLPWLRWRNGWNSKDWLTSSSLHTQHSQDNCTSYIADDFSPEQELQYLGLRDPGGSCKASLRSPRITSAIFYWLRKLLRPSRIQGEGRKRLNLLLEEWHVHTEGRKRWCHLRYKLPQWIALCN